MGAIGRLKVDEEDESILLDLKGNCYKGQFQECHSFMIVSIGQAEATIEDVIDEFVPLEYVSNIFDSEITTGNVFDYNAGMKDLDHDENEEWRAEAAENRRNKKKASKAASASTVCLFLLVLVLLLSRVKLPRPRLFSSSCLATTVLKHVPFLFFFCLYSF